MMDSCTDYTAHEPMQYDVFISHANVDKAEYVNELKKSIDKLGVKVFYDNLIVLFFAHSL